MLLFQPHRDDFQQVQETVRISRRKHNERGEEDQAPAFELADAAVGFDGVGMDVLGLFVYAVIFLL